MIAQIIKLKDTISVTPVLDTNAYATGDRLGSIQTLSGVFRRINRSFDSNSALAKDAPTQCGKVELKSITLIDVDLQSADIDLLFFDALPTVASADNAAISIADAELVEKCIGAYSLNGTYVALAANAVLTESNCGLILKQKSTAADGNLYVVAIIRDSATYTASGLTFRYSFEQS